MSVIKELKRRNVIKVAIAYAIAAWLLIQIVATTFPILKLPDWSTTLVTVLILIGFPLALILAWAYEMTPEGLKKEKDVDRAESITHITGRKLDFIIIGVLAVALIVFAVERFVLLPDRPPATDALQEIIATEVQQSIAVLPFVNMSPDPDQAYFSDGPSEEILNLLAKIPELKVIARTSSFSFKGKNEDVRNIGEVLGVNTVLEGSVRKSGDRMRITAQLIDVSDGANIWSETYDRTMTDIFAVQDDVAAAIIEALQIHVGAIPTRGRPTGSSEAYTLFLMGRTLLNAQNGRDAIVLLRRATELDPEFGEAYELLAYSYWQTSGTGISIAEGRRLTAEIAANALDINPALSFAKALHRDTLAINQPGQTITDAFEQAWRAQRANTKPLRPLIYNLGLYRLSSRGPSFCRAICRVGPSIVGRTLQPGRDSLRDRGYH